MTIVHKHTDINSGGAEPCPRTNDGAGRTAPARTPAHTLDALDRAIDEAPQSGPARQKFVNVDARVLEWLIADSRALAAGGSHPAQTLREMFAGQALAGMLANPATHGDSDLIPYLAEAAYAIADAMFTASKKGGAL